MTNGSAFVEKVEDNTIITGGHFMLTAAGPNINPGTVRSFKEAVQLFSECKKHCRHLGLGVLINDIGTVCDASSCSVVAAAVSTEQFELPEEYLQILKDAGLAQDDLTVFWEKHMRNRGKKLLRKQLAKGNSNLVPSDGGYTYSCPQENVQIMLTRGHPKDQYGTPACPLIMGAYAIEHQRAGFNSSVNFYYVGEDNHLNVSNHFVIEKGRFIATRFSPDLDIKNIYLFKDSVMKNF